jgi:hypothetical protein
LHLFYLILLINQQRLAEQQGTKVNGTKEQNKSSQKIPRNCFFSSPNNQITESLPQEEKISGAEQTW